MKIKVVRLGCVGLVIGTCRAEACDTGLCLGEGSETIQYLEERGRTLNTSPWIYDAP